MSLRQGITASEEAKLKQAIKEGMSWPDIVSACKSVDARGQPQVPFLADVDLATVKKNLFDPLFKAFAPKKDAPK